jgi:hypothetical protein
VRQLTGLARVLDGLIESYQRKVIVVSKRNDTDVSESVSGAKTLHHKLNETLRVRNNQILQTVKFKDECENLTFELNELKSNLAKSEKREKDLADLIGRLKQRAKKFKPVKNSEFEEKT